MTRSLGDNCVLETGSHGGTGGCVLQGNPGSHGSTGCVLQTGSHGGTGGCVLQTGSHGGTGGCTLMEIEDGTP